MHCVSDYTAPPGDDAALWSGYRLVGPHVGQHHCHHRRGGRCIDYRKTLQAKPKSPGPDDSVSLEPAELAALCKDTKTAFGRVDYARKSSAERNENFRRSLCFVKDLKVGDVMSADAMQNVRLGFRLAPKYLKDIIGK